MKFNEKITQSYVMIGLIIQQNFKNYSKVENVERN